MRRIFAAVALATLAAAPLAAQVAAPAGAVGAPPQQVISFQPIGAVLTVYAAEFERVVTPTLTLGVGATGFFPDELSYASGDLKLRYYPQGRPLQGFSFGASVGVTRVAEDFSDDFEGSADEQSATGPSAGFLFDYGWLLGATQRFYVGLGAGAKVLFVDDSEFSDDFIARYPTARLSVGYAF
jgi:hypothetical protein